MAVDIPEEYDMLHDILHEALVQAACGKGRDRHAAQGERFEEQRMQTISHLLRTERGMAFQAIKKLTEGLDLEDINAQKRELLGAINYIAGIIIYLESQNDLTKETL